MTQHTTPPTPKTKKPRTTSQLWARRAKIDELISALKVEQDHITDYLKSQLSE